MSGNMAFQQPNSLLSLSLWLLAAITKVSGSTEQYYEMEKRAFDPNLSCGGYAQTSNTTTCRGFLQAYNLDFATFAALNPRRAVILNGTNDCFGLKINAVYCIAGDVARYISTDGRCGPKYNDAECPGSSFGPCCSVSGYCGSGYPFCGIGNCIAGSCTNGTGWSIDGSCGGKANDYRCGGQFGKCCSLAGWCGNSTDHCRFDNCAGGACLPDPNASTSIITSTASSTTSTPCPAAGCWTSRPVTENPTLSSSTTATTSSSKPPTTTSTTTSSRTTSSTQPSSTTKVSTDGSCGGTLGFTCVGSTFGNCCSASGYCGTTGAYCGEGCQTKWSSACQTTLISSTSGRCGIASGSGKLTCAGGPYANQCCSQSGYCGTTSAFCGTGCQSAYGKCN